MPWLTFSIAAMLKLTYVQLKICSRHRWHFFSYRRTDHNYGESKGRFRKESKGRFKKWTKKVVIYIDQILHMLHTTIAVVQMCNLLQINVQSRKWCFYIEEKKT